MMIVYTERRGRRVAYVDRAKYEFRPSFDEWGRFVVELRAATDDELVHLQSRYLMFRLRDGATADDAKSLAVHLETVFEDVQMMWVGGRPGRRPAGAGRGADQAGSVRLCRSIVT